MHEDIKIAVIGLGYVGLPLAVEFAKKYPVVGFDVNQDRVLELTSGKDRTLEVSSNDLQEVITPHPVKNGLLVTHVPGFLKACNYYIVTVPTPTDANNNPNLSPLMKASKTVGKYLKQDDIVIYESTVYPGVTEEVCVPILEEASGLKFNEGFFAGYSPERINPGDKKHTVTQILKVTSGSTPEAAQKVDTLYKTIIEAGTYLAPSIKVAEAAKVIENSQRDINIAFVNELSKIFRLMDIDTNEVLEAAATKWNFIKFTPGLVGGHCIGVDPYYLAQKAKQLGYHPEIILAGRRMNDGMGSYVANEVVKLMIKKDITVKNANALMLGITFKENCPDIRNSKAIDVYRELISYGINVDVLDPNADALEVLEEYGIKLLSSPEKITKKYSAIVLTVAHSSFGSLNVELLKDSKSVVFDVKSFFPKEQTDARL